MEGILIRVYSPCHLQGVGEKFNINAPNVESHFLLLFTIFFFIPISMSVMPALTILLPYILLDSQSEPQCDLPDQFSSRVQVHSRPYSLPEAG